jgi:acetyltransferase
MDGIVRTLVQVSQLVTDLPAVAELDINPLLADEKGVVALDARIGIGRDEAQDRFAIRPYPQDLEQWIDWQGRALLVRPVRPEDAPLHAAFFAALDIEDMHYQTFAQMRPLEQTQIARLTQIDYDREMAFAAFDEHAAGGPTILGVARAVTDPDNVTAEMVLILRADVKGRGIGRILLAKLVAYCKSRGTRELIGESRADNHRMIALARAFFFEAIPSGTPGVVKLRLTLERESAVA